MHASLRDSSRLGSYGTPTPHLWNSGSSPWRDGKNHSGFWNALRFLAALPLALIMFLVNMMAALVAVVVPLLLIPLAIFAPVLVVAGLVLLTGEIVKLFGG